MTEVELAKPIWSGHCLFPETKTPANSHVRCQNYGGGSSANPDGRFHPCPCLCHVDTDRFECGCGGTLAVALNLGLDEDGDPRYVHVDEGHGRKARALTEFCT